MSKYFNDWGSDEEILHYGVKGMKWRKRKARTSRDVMRKDKGFNPRTVYGLSRNEQDKNRKEYERVLKGHDKLRGIAIDQILKSKERAKKLRSTTNWRKLIDTNKEINDTAFFAQANDRAQEDFRKSKNRNYSAQRKKRKR